MNRAKIYTMYIMAPASVPDNKNTSLKDKRKTQTLQDTFGLQTSKTDWGKVGNALFTSVIATIVWVLVGADIIFFATRPLPGLKSKGTLEYFFPDQISKSPYFMCMKPGKDPRTGKIKCPYNGWKPSAADGKREKPFLAQIEEFIVAAVTIGVDLMSAATSQVENVTSSVDNLTGKMESVTKSPKSQKGGTNDFYSCSRGSLKFDEDLPDPVKKPSFPYYFGGGEVDGLNKGSGTASPLIALAYLMAQMFSMTRGWVKSGFEILRPLVSGGGFGQGVVILLAGLVLYYGLAGIGILVGITAIVCAIRAILGMTTNYVGPYDEIHDMARISRFEYWSKWFLSYLMPVGLATMGGPLISIVVILKIIFDIIIGPLLTRDGRNTIGRILNCNAPWVMVIFGGIFLSSIMLYMESSMWLGMTSVYILLSLFTIYRWFNYVD